MNRRWTAGVIVAVAMGSASLTACSGSASHPQAAGSSATPGSSALKPVAPPPTGASSGTHNFTVPIIADDNVVQGWGSYTKLGTTRVKVTVCAKQTGKAYAVGAVALAYNSSGATKNIGGVVLPEAGTNTACGTTTFLFYTAHLKVHVFIGAHNNTIAKTGPIKILY